MIRSVDRDIAGARSVRGARDQERFPNNSRLRDIKRGGDGNNQVTDEAPR